MIPPKDLKLREGEWTSLTLKSDKFDYPYCEMSFSFTYKYLHIKATVNDFHFKDGDRSWRYGDGFFINFITQTYEGNKPSEKFYAYGFSVMEGERHTTLVNHNGVYFLGSDKSFPPRIEIEEANNKAFYEIKLPWTKLKPFHPLLNEVLGINIRYNSQNDDGSTKRLQLIEDKEFDSELVVEKHYIPVYLHQSAISELQFAFELESNLILENKTNAHTVVYSPEKQVIFLRILLKDQNENVIKEIFQEVKLDKETNHIYQELELAEETAPYIIDVYVNELESLNHEFYKIHLKDLENLQSRIYSFGEKANTPLSESSFYSLNYQIGELRTLIENFDSRDNVKPIQQQFELISELIKSCEEEGHFYTKPGYYLAAFKSKDDQTLQPYSLAFPEKPDPSKESKLLVALHGSGVNEVGFIKFMSQTIKQLGFSYILVGPRGRSLSDSYIGQTERDVFEVVNTVKKMLNIEKTIIYGFSMGGYGVWRLTFLYPDSFDTAIVGSGCPFDPFTNNPDIDVREFRGNAKHINYLVLHGTEDRAVPFKPVKEFIDVLVEEGFNITFEVFKEAGHGNYDPSEIIIKWLGKHG